MIGKAHAYELLWFLPAFWFVCCGMDQCFEKSATWFPLVPEIISLMEDFIMNTKLQNIFLVKL